MEGLWSSGHYFLNYLNVVQDGLYDKSLSQQPVKKAHWTHRRRIDPALLEVRDSICVVGRNRDAVQSIKRVLSDLLPTPIALESLHVKTESDVKDGAFLVPKLLLVATHVAGRKLIDERDDEGQLDFMYDEACEVGADIMVVYLNLPRVLYPAMRHIVYHPKAGELLLPESQVLADLANENCFMTITEGSEMNGMQKNVLKEWAIRLVPNTHPVYKTAQYLSSLEVNSGYLSTPEFQTYYSPSAMESNKTAFYTEVDEASANFQYATEEHPLADVKSKKKKKRDKKLFKFRKDYNRRSYTEEIDYEELENSMELDMYRTSGAVCMDATGSVVL